MKDRHDLHTDRWLSSSSVSFLFFPFVLLSRGRARSCGNPCLGRRNPAGFRIWDVGTTTTMIELIELDGSFASRLEKCDISQAEWPEFRNSISYFLFCLPLPPFPVVVNSGNWADVKIEFPLSLTFIHFGAVAGIFFLFPSGILSGILPAFFRHSSGILPAFFRHSSGMLRPCFRH